MKFKHYISKSVDPYTNLAIEEYLMSIVDKGEIIIFLWQNDNTIVVGKNQEAISECKVELFISQNGKLARRKSGGGAVYHDLGNLNYSIIGYERYLPEKLYAELISDAIVQLGEKPIFNGRNDLLLDNKKVSGNAVYNKGEIICQHGTLLVDSNIDKMEIFLTPSEEKLQRNAVKSVKSRVANLKDFVSDITIDEVKNAIIRCAQSEELRIDITFDAYAQFYRIYKSPRWIYNRKLEE